MTGSARVRLLGGIGTIGGTKLLVETGSARLCFDFGVAYAPGARPFDERLKPRPAALLRDLMYWHLAPPVEGIYPPALAEPAGLVPAGSPGQDPWTVFITHLHLDHMGLTRLLDPSVKLLASEESVRLARGLRAAGEPVEGPELQPVPLSSPVRVGDVEVVPLRVDHDVVGACAYAIGTQDGWVVYSGDLRLHGTHPEWTEAFVQAAAALKPVALFLEGTRLPEERPTNSVPESEIAERVLTIAKAHGGMALVNFYPRNVERIQALGAHAALSGRKFVLQPEVYAQLQAMHEPMDHFLQYRRAGQDGGDVDAQEVRKDPGAYLVHLPYRQITELVDLDPPADSVYMLCNGEPLGIYDPAYPNLMRWLESFGVEGVRTGTSGHAAPEALDAIATGIAPRVLFPIHSHRPDLMQPPGLRIQLPVFGETYRLADLG